MKKLKIEQLQVKSFIADNEGADYATVKGGSVGHHTHVNHQCSQAACYSEYCATVRTCPGHCGSVPL